MLTLRRAPAKLCGDQNAANLYRSRESRLGSTLTSLVRLKAVLLGVPRGSERRYEPWLPTESVGSTTRHRTDWVVTAEAQWTEQSHRCSANEPPRDGPGRCAGAGPAGGSRSIATLRLPRPSVARRGVASGL